MKRLLIIGAGGLGREVYEWTHEINKEKIVWDTIGFLDDNPYALDPYGLSDKIFGSIKDYLVKQGDTLVCAIADTQIRTAICEDFTGRGGVFTSIIHPNAQLSKRCKIGKGVIIYPGAHIYTNSQIEDFVIINTLTAVGHDSKIKRGCVISAQCDIMGFVSLEEEVFLGSGARILPNVIVGKKARVGAGSVVIKNVKGNTTVFGNPARALYNPKAEE